MRTLSENQPPSQGSSFLESFPAERRSLIANQFHGAVREGASTVGDVIRGVKGDAIRRMMFPANRERWNTQRQLISLLESEEARVYAQEVLDRESLPPEEKQRIKADRSDQYRREYLRAQSPTERQLCFLKSLGCEVMPANRLEASELIDRHK